jgi:hypothetical protein
MNAQNKPYTLYSLFVIICLENAGFSIIKCFAII